MYRHLKRISHYSTESSERRYSCEYNTHVINIIKHKMPFLFKIVTFIDEQFCILFLSNFCSKNFSFGIFKIRIRIQNLIFQCRNCLAFYSLTQLFLLLFHFQYVRSLRLRLVLCSSLP